MLIIHCSMEFGLVLNLTHQLAIIMEPCETINIFHAKYIMAFLFAVTNLLRINIA